MVRCAFSDVLCAGVGIANAVQGVLPPTSDSIGTFSLAATFENGDYVTGTAVIDTTAGCVLDEHATLFSHGVVVDGFFNPQRPSLFAPGGVSPSYLLQSTGPGGVSLKLGIPGTSLVGYGGGGLCATGNGLSCAFSDIFLTSTDASDAVTGRLVRPTSVPEPSSVALVTPGLLACRHGRRRAAGRPGRVGRPARQRADRFV